MSETEIYNQFTITLDERSLIKRSESKQPLSEYSRCMAENIGRLNNSPFLTEMLEEKIDLLLKDCEITHQMSMNDAIDALIELSNYASIFVVSENHRGIYNRICKLIQEITKSYPVNM